MKHIRNQGKLPIYKILTLFISVVVLALCLSPSRSLALLGTQDATSCRVFAPESTSYFDPQVALYCESRWEIAGIGYTGSDTEYMGINECENLWYPQLGIPARVCARIAPPGEHGNNSIALGNPRPMLCVYDDPIDPNDWSSSSGSFHEKTSRKDAMTAAQGAKMGVLVVSGPLGWVGQLGVGGTAGDVMMYMGAGMGSWAMVGIAAGIGAAVAAILSEYNHWVLEDKGCVDIPLGPIPKEFCNDCWEIKRTPLPRAEIDASATFEETKILVTVCKSATTHKTKRCPSEGSILAGEIGEQFIITPRTPSFLACHNINDSAAYTAGENPNYNPVYHTNNPDDNRKVCAEITRTRDNMVCVYEEHVDTRTTQTVKNMINCFERPNFMPAPSVNNNASTFTNPNITVVLGKGTFKDQVTLTVDPGTYIPSINPDPSWTANCGYVHQIEFCAYRPCTSYVPDGAGGERCNSWSSEICVEGYKTPPMVVANKSDDQIIRGLPNVQRAAGADELPAVWEYMPLVDPAQPQDILNFTQEICDLYAPSPSTKCPRTCYERDTARRCVNQDGACESSAYPDMIDGICYNYASSLASDSYFVNETTQYTRPSTPEEMDLCVGIPPPEDDTVYSSPGTYNYTIPVNCNALRVKMYGGGGAGAASGGGDTWDSAGGSGAYGEWEVRVNPGDVHSLSVGYGSYRCGGGTGSHDGTHSQFVHVNGSNYLRAGGGYRIQSPWAGGPGGYLSRNWDSAANYIELPGTRNGIHGPHSGAWARGPAGGYAWDQCWSHCVRPPHAPRPMDPYNTTQPKDNPYPPTHIYQPGAGGCSHDNPSWEPWGEGGHGEVRLNCFGQLSDMPPRYGMRLWLDAVEINGAGMAVPGSNTPMSIWKDKSLHNRHVNQTDVNRQPMFIFSGQNGLPVVRFNGYPTNNSGANDYDYLRMAADHRMSLSTGLTVFLVAKHNDLPGVTEDDHYFLGYENGWSRWRISHKQFQSNLGGGPFSGFPHGVFKILTTRATTSGNIDYYINGTLKDNDTITSGQFTQNSEFWVGGAETGGHYSLNGDIAEIIIYGYPVTLTEQRDIETYLQTKWDIRDVTPASIAGLRLWLDAQDPKGDNNSTPLPADGSQVLRWDDKSTNDWDAVTSAPYGPTFTSNTINGHYAMVFNGTDNVMNLPDGTLTYANAVYSLSSVIKIGPSIYNQGFLGSGYFVNNRAMAFRVNGSGGTTGTMHHYWWANDITSIQTISSGNSYIYSVTYDSNPSITRTVYINGVKDTAFNPSTAKNSEGLNTTVGKTVASEYWNGAIGEIQFYGTTLTAQELRWVELYLSDKWGIAVP